MPSVNHSDFGTRRPTADDKSGGVVFSRWGQPVSQAQSQSCLARFRNYLSKFWASKKVVPYQPSSDEPPTHSVSARQPSSNLTTVDLTKEIMEDGESVPIGIILAKHFMKDGQHNDGAKPLQIKEMSKIANKAFVKALQDSPVDSKIKEPLIAAIQASGDVEDQFNTGNIKKDAFTSTVREHFTKHHVLTLSDFGCSHHSVGLNVYKNNDNSYDIVLCNRGFGSGPEKEERNWWPQFIGTKRPLNNVDRRFFQVKLNDQNAAIELLHTLYSLNNKSSMSPVYKAMEKAGECQVCTDVSSEIHYTGHCGFLNKQAALKQVCQRKLGGVSVYKAQRQNLFSCIKSYIESSSNPDLKTLLEEYEGLQNITKTLKPLVNTNGSESFHDQYVQGIQDAIKALMSHANFASEMKRLNIYIDRMLKNHQLKPFDKAFLNQVRFGIDSLKIQGDQNTKNIEKNKFLKNINALNETHDALATESLEKFQMQPMAPEQFNVIKPLIQAKAKGLFQALGGRIEGNAWDTSTPTGKVLYWVAISETLYDLKLNIQMLDTARELESQLKDAATVDRFKTAVNGMTEDEFDLSQALILKTAKGLFQALGGTFTEDGAWETSTPTGKVLYRVATSETLDALNLNIQMLDTARELERQLNAAATIDSFKTAVNKMTKDEFRLCRPLIKKTAKRLFASIEVGGTFTENGAWETSTPTGKVLYRVATSETVSDMNSHLQKLDRARNLESQLNAAATVDRFKTAVNGMTEDEFDLSQALIQKTAKRLFESTEVGGTFTEDGAWITNTETKKALFNMSNCHSFSKLKTHLKNIPDMIT